MVHTHPFPPPYISKGISSLGPAGCHPHRCSGRKTNQTQKEKRENVRSESQRGEKI